MMDRVRDVSAIALRAVARAHCLPNSGVRRRSSVLCADLRKGGLGLGWFTSVEAATDRATTNAVVFGPCRRHAGDDGVFKLDSRESRFCGDGPLDKNTEPDLPDIAHAIVQLQFMSIADKIMRLARTAKICSVQALDFHLAPL
jgi:hypothetical protein